MRFWRCACTGSIGLEIQALIEENKKTLKNIAEYEDILENHDSMTRVIIRDMDAVRKAFSRPRRTSVENAEEIVLEEKKIEEMPVHVPDGPASDMPKPSI